VSKKSGDEALKEVQERARELGQDDSYNHPFPSNNIVKFERPDGSVGYYLSVNVGPLRRIFDRVHGASVFPELTSDVQQALLRDIDVQKEVMRFDVTTFTTKTGDVNMKFDNLIKALMAFLASRAESNKAMLSS
jgi:hypothetical protein